MNKKKIVSSFLLIGLALIMGLGPVSCSNTLTQLSYLHNSYYYSGRDRAVIAVTDDDGNIFLSWRLFINDGPEIGFNVYRDGVKLNTAILGPAYTDFVDPFGSVTNEYQIEILMAGNSVGFTEPIYPLAEDYIRIPLEKPGPYRTYLSNGLEYGPHNIQGQGIPYFYTSLDAVPVDMNGDGHLDLVFFWQPSNEGDPGVSHFMSANTFIDVYSIKDRSKLWASGKLIDLGPNIGGSNHTAMLYVSDFDGDGYGEIMVKTAPLTTDTAGRVLGPVIDGQIVYWQLVDVDNLADWALRGEGHLLDHNGDEMAVADVWKRGDAGGMLYINRNNNTTAANPAQQVNYGPEYFSIFDHNGEFLKTIFDPLPRNQYGNYNTSTNTNTGFRWNGGMGYFGPDNLGRDGFLSAVHQRGYYSGARTQIACMDWDGETLDVRWIFVSGNNTYTGGMSTMITNATTNPWQNNGTWNNSSTNGPYPEKAKTGNNVGGADMGNHQQVRADVDGDGYDEILLGPSAINNDGTILWNIAGTSTGGFNWGHGDAMHVSLFHPDADHLSIYGVQEGSRGQYLLDARNGSVKWRQTATEDTGRAGVGSVDPDVPGFQFWATMNSAWSPTTAYDGTILSPGPVTMPQDVSGNLFDFVKGGANYTGPVNFAIYWDGGTGREMADGGYQALADPSGASDLDAYILKGYKVSEGVYTSRLLKLFPGMRTNSGTKQVPVLQADLFGDWREEVVHRNRAGDELRIYTTTYPTIHDGSYEAIPETGIPTLQDNHQYWIGVLGQGACYNQPPWPSWYIGYNMKPIER